METIRVKTRIGADGLLKLEMPVGVANVDADVVIVFAVQPTTEEEDWADFVNATYGSLADDPIERPAPLPPDVRDEIT
ncbi:MAG: hypothetical protein K8S97_11110 [Anaerolineae bacterium]|nr:hypothetical protein [Anaerolineae bacterium]